MCHDWFDSDCSIIWDDAQMHRFLGTGTSGYEGYHAAETCGTCESAHVLCVMNLTAADEIRSALRNDPGTLITVIDRYRNLVSVNTTTGILTIAGCDGGILAQYQLTVDQLESARS